MWLGTNRNHVRFSVIRRDTGHCGHRQTYCCRHTAGSIPGERGIRIGDFGGPTWYDLWRWAVGVPRSSRIFGDSRRREAARQRRSRGPLLARGVEIAYGKIGSAGNPRSRLHSGASACGSCAATCGRSFRRGRAPQQHTGYSSALSAAVFNRREARRQRRARAEEAAEKSQKDAGLCRNRLKNGGAVKPPFTEATEAISLI